MILTGKHSERTFLRGVGTALALPLLDGMVPAGKAATLSPCGWAFFYPQRSDRQ